ncbi:hypothetical protein NPX13_g1242 [Xylaria arbuscula]|uniref:Major facilitator superfamily (MFS) profile domain-containing protein n=1 Tax=Xylaria arbuscula TaxID=114810 RepID=A0A9W8TQC7_9PEZI|nr:hypothetical protein NPX13_g1242 [Xylaria arbuscula]
MASQSSKTLELQPNMSECSTPDKRENLEMAPAPKPLVWVSGWRLMAIAIGQTLALFIVQSESSITSTAITSITDDLGSFEKSSWVFTAYLLTYSAFPILLSKLSDILGRKQVLLSCILLFVIFSGACGASQTLVQLIMFRWVKGLGAGGVVAICIGYGFELRPPEKWPVHSSILTIAAAIAVAISPLIGAAFAVKRQWRWCFLLSVPIGVTASAILLIGMPRKLQLEPASRFEGPQARSQILSRLKRLDFPGAVMLVAASVFLMTALQLAAEGYSFRSPRVLILLILSPVSLVAFATWQWVIARNVYDSDPVLPWNLLTNRVFMAAVCNAWLSGSVLVVTVVQIPQRYIIVNGLSAIDAGVRLLPFVVVMASTSVILTIIMAKWKLHAVYCLMIGALLETAGVAGLSQTSMHQEINTSQYGFQILAGIGVGFFNILLLLMTPHIVAKEHLAVGNGAINQFRILGGSLGLSIATVATAPTLRASLLQIIGAQQTALVLDRTNEISNLPSDLQVIVRERFASMYNTQMTILVGISAAQLIVSILQWQKKAIILKK